MLTALDLLDKGILNGTGVGVQEVGSFSTEVLQNFQGLVRDLAEVRITCGSGALQLACLLLQQGLHLALAVSLG